MNEINILQKLDLIENLPTLPVVVNQLQQLIANSGSSMAQIATVIARDQSICSKVIRLVNSAFYGLQSRVSSIQQAITLLGLTTVKNIVTGVAIVNTFGEGGSASLFDREKFWLHSFSTAALAKEIARIRCASEPEDFFMAGLLHDIGILVLDQYFHGQFIETVQDCLKNETLFIEAEQKLLHTTHCDIGEYLAGKWHLPDIFILAIQHHHNPLNILNDSGSYLEVILTIHVADAYVQNKGGHIGVQCSPVQLSRVSLRRLGINEHDLAMGWEDVASQIKPLMREWGK